jgi:hypothetical protein
MPINWNGSWPKTSGEKINVDDVNDLKTNIETIEIEKSSKVSIIENINNNYILNINDNGKIKNCTNSTAINITIPLNSSVLFPIGTEIGFIRQGAGTVSFIPESGVNIQSIDNKRKIKGQFASAAIIKVGTDTWSLAGSLEL